MYNKKAVISKNIRTLLFAGIIAAMILPFSNMDMAFDDQYVKAWPYDAVQDNSHYISDIIGETGLQIEVEIGDFEEISHKSKGRTSNHSTLIGGISVAKEGDGLRDDSTLGFKATTESGEKGFVIAGHAANKDDKIYQRAGGNYVGDVILDGEEEGCGCAFVESDKRIADKIFKNSRQTYTIKDYAIESDFEYGKFLKKSGVATGITYGDILAKHPSGLHAIQTSIPVAHGDSGSPVFSSYGYSGAELYGILIQGSSDGKTSLMEPYPSIKDSLDLK